MRAEEEEKDGAAWDSPKEKTSVAVAMAGMQAEAKVRASAEAQAADTHAQGQAPPVQSSSYGLTGTAQLTAHQPAS